MNYHIMRDDPDKKAQTVLLTIECEPGYAQWILALAALLARDPATPLSYSALPEALLELGKSLAVSDDGLPYEFWSPLCSELVDRFIELTSAYQRALNFNMRLWEEEFLDSVALVQSKWSLGTDETLFQAIRSIVKLVGSRSAGPDQHRIYCDTFRTPLDFQNWVDRILLDPRVTNDDIAAAHLRAFDPERLKQLLRSWKEALEDLHGDEVSF